jgi:excisionase family DNA binding protein
MTSSFTEPLLTAEQAAEALGLSRPGFWKAVDQGRLPAPFYPASRAPRWQRSELLAALEKTRALPRHAKMARQLRSTG